MRDIAADKSQLQNSPPFDVLYLMPKSPLGPPGLWLAVRIIPPTKIFAISNYNSRWHGTLRNELQNLITPAYLLDFGESIIFTQNELKQYDDLALKNCQSPKHRQCFLNDKSGVGMIDDMQDYTVNGLLYFPPPFCFFLAKLCIQ